MGSSLTENGGQYRIKTVVDRNGGDADIWIHYTDANNGYRVRFNSIDEIWVDKVVTLTHGIGFADRCFAP